MPGASIQEAANFVVFGSKRGFDEMNYTVSRRKNVESDLLTPVSDLDLGAACLTSRVLCFCVVHGDVAGCPRLLLNLWSTPKHSKEILCSNQLGR